jgi:radical SAM superfamily enzyme YgiQ (UPF0313 family)
MAIEFFDDRLELIDYETKTDVVAITVETYTALRAYHIAEKFRKRGIPVVVGGYHPTHLPGEASCHADAVVVGNAESVWPEVISDARRKRLRKRYDGKVGFSSELPDRRIFQDKKYLPLGLVETGRGALFNANFVISLHIIRRNIMPAPFQRSWVISSSRARDFSFLLMIIWWLILGIPFDCARKWLN